jgi:hypothetical protein
MKNYISRKCKGFRFKGGPLLRWDSEMKNYIRQVGEVVTQGENYVTLKFDNGKLWVYPISLIEPHLVDVDSNVDSNVDTYPEIPQLGEGVEMEVSHDGITWRNRNIIAKKHDGLFISDYGSFWQYARPIHKVKKYTKEELVKIVGHDFEMV